MKSSSKERRKLERDSNKTKRVRIHYDLLYPLFVKF